jgi:hypothetical protein
MPMKVTRLILAATAMKLAAMTTRISEPVEVVIQNPQ